MVSTAVLLGAGFSRWAANVPTAAELFDFGIAIWPRESDRISHLFAQKERWDGSNPGGTAEMFIADILQNGSAVDRETLLWYIGRRLSEPLIRFESSRGRNRRRTLAIGEPLAARLPGVVNARRYLNPLFGQNDIAGVITTNYDLLVEYALGPKRFVYDKEGEELDGYLSPFRKVPVTLTGTVVVAKLHGSLSWDGRRKYADARRAITGQALIVAPTPEKLAPRRLQRVWRKAAEILSRAERLVVFGFSFNAYDAAVLTLLRGSGAKLGTIELIDIVSRRSSAAELWPNADIHEKPPPDRAVEPASFPDPNGATEAARALSLRAIDPSQIGLFKSGWSVRGLTEFAADEREC